MKKLKETLKTYKKPLKFIKKLFYKNKLITHEYCTI